MKAVLVAALLVPAGLVLAGCTTAGTPTPATGAAALPAGRSVLLFRPVLAAQSPTTPTSQAGGVPRALEPSTAPQQQAIEAERKTRQDPALANPADHQPLVSAFRCPDEDPLAGQDDPALPLLTCDRKTGERFVLGPAALGNDDIARATARPDENSGGFVVEVEFTPGGAEAWGRLTAESVGQRIGLVLNTSVLSAPSVNEPILGGTAIISGQFDRSEAEELAARLGGR
ncbi:SecDF P1 head subdomain-containing protein [Actinosynnema sp. CS-041913]|uniref:SecDF P1 head subdomain-containing protein n=1 Tax=Actinosynnema sp. CS-041913 TaxID=3239917 RepID=UPI003D94A7E0